MGDNARLSFTNEQTRFFLETCIGEVNRVGRRGSSLHVTSWAVLANKLDEMFHKKANQKQLKNKFDYLKANYMGWCYLREKTGNIYNSDTNTFNLTSEEWDDFCKVHPKASSLKSTPLPYPELCAMLFDKTVASGSIRRSVAPQRTSSSSLNSNVQGIRIESEDDSTHQGCDTSFDGGPSVPRRATVPDNDGGRPKKKGKNTIDLTDLEVDMRKVLANLAADTSKGPTIDDCHNKLKGVGLEATDPIYLAAFGLFSQPSNNFREAWMALPSDPDVLKNWIIMMAKMMGLMK